MGKGEIAHYEQFLLFPQCFQKTCFPEAAKGVIVWEWVNSFQSKDMANVKVFTDKETHRWMNGQTNQPKTIYPNLSMWGHKNYDSCEAGDTGIMCLSPTSPCKQIFFINSEILQI